MKIGIGITSYNRPECLKECLEHIFKHTLSKIYCLDDYDVCVKSLVNQASCDYELTKSKDQVKIVVSTDTNEDRRGVAFRKNECLRALKDCDYVFLFDDDCFPIKDGWVEFFVKENIGHCMYLSHKLHNFKYQKEGVKAFSDCGGVFLYMDKNAIDKVGAFNENFSPYSFEHCEWSMRWNDKKREFYMLEGTENYIYSHDYSTPNHKSSITDEEKQKCIKNNWSKFFDCKIDSIYLPL